MHELSVLVAQIGARRHYAVPCALQASGVLVRLETDLCADLLPWRWLDNLLPVRMRPGPLRRLLGRRVPGVPRAKIRGRFGWFLGAALRGRGARLATEDWAYRNASFCRSVARRGLGAADTVYAFNAAALEIFEAARAQGLRCVLDQTAAPWRWNTSMLTRERARWPDWEARPAEIDESGALVAREEAEWRLADRIVCGSRFVVDAIGSVGGPVEKCRVVRYPAPAASTHALAATRDDGARPLRVLFAGSLQLRKGIQYLWQACETLEDAVEVRVVGPSLLSEAADRRLRQRMDVVGSVARSAMAQHYAWADVLVLPTLSEGSANVCHEAMAAGLPVITTAHAGSAVEDGLGGWIVPVGDAEALAAAIVAAAEDRDRLRALGAVAARAAVARTLPEYGAALVQAMVGP